MIDKYISGTCERISPEAPVPVILKKKEDFKPGGAANVALNLAMLGAKVTLLTSIGDDEDGKNLLQRLDEHGIAIITGNNKHTIIKTRIIANNQQVARIDDEKEKESYKFALDENGVKYVKDIIEKHDIVLLSDYNKGVLSQELVDLTLKIAKKENKFIALDPKPSNKIKFEGFDLITPNKKEAFELLGRNTIDLNEAVIRLDERYKTRILAVTLGEEGLGISEDGKTIKVYPSLAKEVFDVCGAGDTAISLLVLTLGNKVSIDEAAFLTNIACGIVVGKHGTATTTQQEILSWAAKSN